MAQSTPRSSALGDWGLTPRPGRRDSLKIAALLTSTPLLLACAAAVASSWWVGLLIAAGAAVTAVAGPFLQLRRLSRRYGGHTAAPGSEPRLENLVRGLSRDHGLARPRMVVLESAPPNAFVWRPLIGSAVLAISRSYLEALSRTELEAVIAHCLLRLSSADARAATVGVLLGGSGRWIVPRVGFADDVRAASLTRYPPGLAAAIEKAVPPDILGPLWFVAGSASHRSARERIEQLADL
jgi:hypothetical protein